MRETGLEPASAYCTHEPESCASANSAIPADKVVGRGGFEPPKRVAADLQSAPFGHSGTYPRYQFPSSSKGWSWRWDSNPQPADYKSAALPIELLQHKLASNRRGIQKKCDPDGARTHDLQRDRLAL